MYSSFLEDIMDRWDSCILVALYLSTRFAGVIFSLNLKLLFIGYVTDLNHSFIYTRVRLI